MMSAAKLIAFIALLAVLSEAHVFSEPGFGVTWSYNDTIFPPSQWSTNFPKCGGKAQSPINFEPMKVSTADGLIALALDYTSPDQETLSCWNNGASLNAVFPKPSNHKFTDGYGTVYYLSSVHLHWNDKTTKGSEHTIDSRLDPVEVHLVHYNSAYSSYEAAVASGKSDAISVIGILMKIGSPNAALDKLLAVANKEPIPESSKPNTTITGFDPRALLSSSTDRLDYLHYNGSLTTPGCQEIVRWYVLQTRSTLSDAQLVALRAFHHSCTIQMTSNNRPVQALNGRSVVAFPKLHAITKVVDRYSITAASVSLALGLFGSISTIITFIAILVHSRFHRPN